MTFEMDTIVAAFEQHRERYTEKWPLDHHLELWRSASAAFAGPSEDEFRIVYDALSKTWKAMRRATEKWDVKLTFSKLCDLDSNYSKKKLSDLTSRDATPLWVLIKSVEALKVNKYGSSVVAISKFLHFWNPRLFVIVDDAVMWNHVFDRWWLWDSFKQTRAAVDEMLPDAPAKRNDYSCDLSSYLAVLFWSSDLLRSNPGILSRFREYLGPSHLTAMPDADSFEAAAIEWFLLGVAELLPAGVTLNHADNRVVLRLA